MIKVAAYCRVSTDKDDQANSFESQQRYFREYIDRQPEWELVDVYADEGITGTSTKKRTAFNRMINDAYRGRMLRLIYCPLWEFSYARRISSGSWSGIIAGIASSLPSCMACA